MSRYTIHKENKKLTYGFDHALGYFYDITDESKPDDSPEYLIEEKSSMLQRMNRGQFAEVLKEWGAREDHMMSVALDQPF